jgi:hypothetical protein
MRCNKTISHASFSERMTPAPAVAAQQWHSSKARVNMSRCFAHLSVLTHLSGSPAGPEARGKVDEASGTIKDKVADVADAVKDRLHKDQLSRPSAIAGSAAADRRD